MIMISFIRSVSRFPFSAVHLPNHTTTPIKIPANLTLNLSLLVTNCYMRPYFWSISCLVARGSETFLPIFQSFVSIGTITQKIMTINLSHWYNNALWHSFSVNLVFLVANTQLYNLPCQFIPGFFELRGVFALRPLPNHPWLPSRVSDLVSSDFKS